MSSRLKNPVYWSDRAEELQAIASNVKDLQAQETLLRCADDYDRLAERAVQRLRTNGPA